MGSSGRQGRSVSREAYDTPSFSRSAVKEGGGSWFTVPAFSMQAVTGESKMSTASVTPCLAGLFGRLTDDAMPPGTAYVLVLRQAEGSFPGGRYGAASQAPDDVSSSTVSVRSISLPEKTWGYEADMSATITFSTLYGY